MTKILYTYKTTINGKEVEVKRYAPAERTDQVVSEEELDSFEGEAPAPKAKRKAKDLVEDFNERFLFENLAEEDEDGD